MLTLFHCPGSCSLASMIALEEAGATYETTIVDLMSGQQGNPEYLAVNPKGKVPALVTDMGVITENPAIMLFVAMTYPQSGIAPLDDPYELARMNAFNAFLASTLQPSAAPLGRPQRYLDDPAQYPALAAKAIGNLTAHFDMIENKLLTGPWVLGDRYSIADGYLFVFSELIARLSLDSNRFGRILEHRERALQRPAISKLAG